QCGSDGLIGLCESHARIRGRGRKYGDRADESWSALRDAIGSNGSAAQVGRGAEEGTVHGPLNTRQRIDGSGRSAERSARNELDLSTLRMQRIGAGGIDVHGHKEPPVITGDKNERSAAARQDQ